MKIYRPDYFDTFRCIAADCPDSCCKEWGVQVDSASAAWYRALPGELGDRLREVLCDEDGETLMSIVDGRCPMWREDGLCRIQAELGEAALCRTCREFPRLTHDYGDFVELGLELSCPEAAKFILNGENSQVFVEETGEVVLPEYDVDAMAVLLDTRREALTLLSQERPMGERLSLLLLYGCHAQSLLDGLEAPPFDPEAALEMAKTMAKPGNILDIRDFYLQLELLTPQWKDLLETPEDGPWDQGTAALCRYLVERYWLQAVADYDLYSRVKFIITACLLLKHLSGSLLHRAQLWSKEIENDAGNVDALLDAAYDHPAFTDDKLLSLLLDGNAAG